MADGSRHSMYMVAETTYGVIPSNPAFTPIRHTGTTLGLTKDELQSEEIRNDRQITDFRHGARQVGGDISINLSCESYDEILEALLGGTWALDTPVVGTDQLKAGTIRRSFTIERHFSDIPASGKPYHRFTGVEFNSLQLQINANAMVTGTIGVIGADMVIAESPISGATYDEPTTTAILDSFTGTLQEGGATIGVVTEIQLNIENGLEPRFVVGSKTTLRPSIGRSNVTGQITAYFEDSSLLEKFVNETESSLQFELVDGQGNLLRFILPRIKYSGGQPDVQGEGPITLAMPFQALMDPATETNIIIERKFA